jgi:hypothetical protein
MEPDYIPDPQYDPPPPESPHGSPDSYEASLGFTSFIPYLDLSGHLEEKQPHV